MTIDEMEETYSEVVFLDEDAEKVFPMVFELEDLSGTDHELCQYDFDIKVTNMDDNVQLNAFSYDKCE